MATFQIQVGKQRLIIKILSVKLKIYREPALETCDIIYFESQGFPKSIVKKYISTEKGISLPNGELFLPL